MANEYLLAMIDDLLFFVDHHPTFDGEIVDNIINSYQMCGMMTVKETEYLENIYETWHVASYVGKKIYGEAYPDYTETEDT